MNKKRLRKLIQKPLRFHHQDIHEELAEIKLELRMLSELIVCLSEVHAQFSQALYACLECIESHETDVHNGRHDSKDTGS